MKNWSISKKLWTLSLFTIVNIVVLSVVNYRSISQLSESIDDLGQKQIKSIRTMTLADMMHDAMRASAYGAIVFAADSKKVADEKKEYEEFSSRFNEYLKTIGELTEDDKNIQSALKETLSKVADYTQAGHEIIKYAEENRAPEAIAATDKFLVTFNQLAEEMEGLGEMIEKESAAKVLESNKRAENANTLAIVLSAVAVLITFVSSFFNNRQLVSSLSRLINSLTEESKIVTSTSQTSAEIAEKLSAASVEQASTLQETVSSIDEISAMVARNSDSSASSAKTSETTALSAQKGKEKADQMMISINSIASGNDEILTQMQKSNKEISDIVKVIQEISEKTKVINDIVFQTKLLSFNASVEAARAGEHGKGFAVVAEEVGNLASMSGKAADEISEMLSKSVKRVTDIVGGTKDLMDTLIGQSKQKIEAGSATAQECAKALDEILANVQAVNGMVREISEASQEQSSGVKAVNIAMTELDQVAQTNSIAAQESSQAAYELKSQAGRLVGLISELNNLVNGFQSESGQIAAGKQTRPQSKGDNIVPIKRTSSGPKKYVDQPARKVVGLANSAPMKDDSRFEDI